MELDEAFGSVGEFGPSQKRLTAFLVLLQVGGGTRGCSARPVPVPGGGLPPFAAAGWRPRVPRGAGWGGRGAVGARRDFMGRERDEGGWRLPGGRAGGRGGRGRLFPLAPASVRPRRRLCVF